MVLTVADRATVKNQTLEEKDSSIKYSGTWGNNTSPAFSGGGSTYTNEDKASFELEFSGASSSIPSIPC